ncbi:hypothetical protein F4804DRAFT_3459 [Jackrogersella minutella]|nr:hypothetical protein F4804DRAFT_3459 [Jackrogersella minutella]
MAYWEASQSPPRHSTHQHRRHYQPRDENNSHEMLDNRPSLKHPRKQHKSSLTIPKSNATSQPQPQPQPQRLLQTRYDIVENWLEQTARRNPHPWPRTSQEHREAVADSSYPSRPLDVTSPYNKHSGRVDPRWSPRHGFPSGNLHQSASPFRDLGLKDPRKSTRRRTTPSDSSFISGFGNSTKPPDYRPRSIQQDRENISPARPLREAGLVPLGASSTTSHKDEQMNFEKRPRHKTREDKYETKKKKRNREQEGGTGHEDYRRKKRKKTEKRKSMLSSKNVVNNFTSNAVLNDRITVPPHLKPGLFDNRRASKKQPISDLAFSEMQFLKHQKRNPQPNQLSKSRLREKRREDREMEEVSSFFLPQRAEGNTRNPRSHSPGIENTHQELEYRARQLPYAHFQGRSGPSLSDCRLFSEHTHVSESRGDTEVPSLNPPEFINDENDSEKNTVYLTWSTSRCSPQVSRAGVSSSLNASGSVKTTTPEPIKRDLIATGIYRDTGIPLYDDHLTSQGMERKKTDSKTPNTCRKEAGGSIYSPRHKSHGSQKVKYRDQAIMTDSSVQCLDPSNDVQRTEGCQASGFQEESASREPHTAQDVDRRKIARSVRSGPVERGSSKQPVQSSTVSSPKARARQQSPRITEVEANRSLEERRQVTSNQASMPPKDDMPPPPIPHTRSIPSLMTDAQNGETNPPKQDVPSANIVTDESQTSHIVSHNNGTQDIQGPPESYNQTTSSSDPTLNNEHTLSSVDIASWIPQRTPSARTTETRSIQSRPRMKSPIYADQYERTLSGSSCQRDSTESRVPESMAEFIARIESESQLQSRPRGHGVLGLESCLETVPSYPLDKKLFHEQLSDHDGREWTHSHLAPGPHLSYAEPESTRTVQQHEEPYCIEEQYPGYGIGVPRVLSDFKPLEDVDEECFEMSSFWRPNQFSQF